MKSTVASGLALAAAIALSACGGSGGDFAGRMTALCIKERGDVDRVACECASRVINGALSEPDRKLAMISLDAEEGRFKTRDDARSALQTIGLDPDNAEEIMGGFVQRMMMVEAKATAECGVS
jgi:hypothetical protein